MKRARVVILGEGRHSERSEESCPNSDVRQILRCAQNDGVSAVYCIRVKCYESCTQMRILIAAMFAALLLTGMLGATADAVPLAPTIDHFIPGSVDLAILTDDVALTAKDWQQTAIGKLLQSESFVPLRQSLAARDMPAPLYLKPALGFDWPELAALDCPAAYVVFSIGGKKEGDRRQRKRPAR